MTDTSSSNTTESQSSGPVGGQTPGAQAPAATATAPTAPTVPPPVAPPKPPSLADVLKRPDLQKVIDAKVAKAAEDAIAAQREADAAAKRDAELSEVEKLRRGLEQAKAAEAETQARLAEQTFRLDFFGALAGTGAQVQDARDTSYLADLARKLVDDGMSIGDAISQITAERPHFFRGADGTGSQANGQAQQQQQPQQGQAHQQVQAAVAPVTTTLARPQGASAPTNPPPPDLRNATDAQLREYERSMGLNVN